MRRVYFASVMRGEILLHFESFSHIVYVQIIRDTSMQMIAHKYLMLGASLLVLHCMVLGQTASASAGRQVEVKPLRDSLARVTEEVDLLQHFLEASTVDPALLYHSKVRAWVLNNPVLRDSLFNALMQTDSSLQAEAGSDAEILGTLQDDIVQVRFGTAVFKGVTLRRALARSPDPSLYRRLAESFRYSRDVELRDPTFRFATPLQPELMTTESMLRRFNPVNRQDAPDPSRGSVELALDRLLVRIGPTWGGELRLGADEINNPFWANGTIAALAVHDRYRFGLILPVGIGGSSFELFQPLLFRARRLAGARGFLGEFDAGGLGGTICITRFSIDDASTVPDPRQFWFVSGRADLYYSFAVALDPTHLARAKVGGGFHRITPAAILPAPQDPASNYVALQEHKNIISPYVKIEYLYHTDSDVFRASLQYYNLTLMVAGEMEIVPGILGIEAKYVWPVGGNLQLWEYPEFFLISPTFHITF